jgi:transcriptional regulator with XRE-family HTH domain
MELNYKEIGTRLKIVRGKMTQQAFSEQFGISKSYVKKTEGGGKPSLEYLVDIAIKQGVSLDWLLIGVHPKNEKNEPTIINIELKRMCEILKSIYESGDTELRIWAKIQFDHAFEAYIKKRLRVAEEDSTYRA